MKLKEYRTTLGISYREAAKQIGVDRNGYLGWEHGRIIPNRDNMERIKNWSGGKVQPGDFYDA